MYQFGFSSVIWETILDSNPEVICEFMADGNKVPNFSLLIHWAFQDKFAKIQCDL